MKLSVSNNKIWITNVSSPLIRAVDKITSFYRKGYRFSPQFRLGTWDGKEHLIRKVKYGYVAPIGIIEDLLSVAEEWGEEVHIEDNRRLPDTSIHTLWNEEWKLRPYQQEAVSSVVDTPIEDIRAGKGLLRLPTRSGKTVIAAGIIDKLKVRTLFLVQSEMLLAQTISLFQKVLQVPIGKIGGGEWVEEPITVASCQTLVKRFETEEVKKLLERSDLVIFDECHHLEGEKWREIVQSCEAPYKIGLSATIYLDPVGENQKGTIWIRAATGVVLYTLAPSDLIRLGYLMRPSIKLHIYGHTSTYPDFQTSYSVGVVDNFHRNAVIVDIVEQSVKEGYFTLVVASRVKHIDNLSREMDKRGINHATITGKTKPKDRRQIVDRYVKGDIKVLVGTVFGEGVDIPRIECVVNAQGGKSKKGTMQRFRNLTPSDGKTEAIFHDVMDKDVKWLSDHSLARLAAYRENEEFSITIAKRITQKQE